VNIALIDYGAGNVPSVERALQRLGAASRRIVQPADLASAGAIILPGVGHYSAIIRALDSQNLRSPLMEAIARSIPFLGICLGLQALYAGSEEAPALVGLGLLAGGVSSLPQTSKLPHMGWNRLRIVKPTPLLDGLGESDYFYFAHTFAAPHSAENAVAFCDYGTTFTAALHSGNVFATQFHPEKSGAAGARLLQNFLRLAAMSNLA
jgi:imidazole glycerol phosphate synthase glutamine amidotransferase subunit